MLSLPSLHLTRASKMRRFPGMTAMLGLLDVMSYALIQPTPAMVIMSLLLSLGPSATSARGLGVPSQVRIDADGPSLVLNGAGIRRVMASDVYVAALYLPNKTRSGKRILQDDLPSRLYVRLLRDVSARQLDSSINDAFADTSTAGEQLQLDERFRNFKAILETSPEISMGTEIAMDYLPEWGTAVYVNGNQKGRIPGFDFRAALLRIWIGDRCSDARLKYALLGGS